MSLTAIQSILFSASAAAEKKKKEKEKNKRGWVGMSNLHCVTELHSLLSCQNRKKLSGESSSDVSSPAHPDPLPCAAIVPPIALFLFLPPAAAAGRPCPLAKAGQVVVKVKVAAMNLLDCKLQRGDLRPFMPPRLPFTPGAPTQQTNEEEA